MEKTKVASMRGGCAAAPEEIPSAQFSPVIYGNFIPVMTQGAVLRFFCMLLHVSTQLCGRIGRHVQAPLRVVHWRRDSIAERPRKIGYWKCWGRLRPLLLIGVYGLLIECHMKRRSAILLGTACAS